MKQTNWTQMFNKKSANTPLLLRNCTSKNSLKPLFKVNAEAKTSLNIGVFVLFLFLICLLHDAKIHCKGTITYQLPNDVTAAPFSVGFFAAGRWEKDTENGAAETSLRTFVCSKVCIFWGGQKFEKSSPYFCPQYIQTKVMWRFCKI